MPVRTKTQTETLTTLKPQDIVVLLKLVTFGKKSWTLTALSKSLAMPLSSLNQALARVHACNLYNRRRHIVLPQALEEFLVHGIRYVFPAARGPIVRGIPTASAAPPLNKVMDAEALSWPPVWAEPRGTQQGYAIIPLFSGVQQIASEDPPLYELLALVDALREGRARERQLAAAELSVRLKDYQQQVAKI